MCGEAAEWTGLYDWGKWSSVLLDWAFLCVGEIATQPFVFWLTVASRGRSLWVHLLNFRCAQDELHFLCSFRLISRKLLCCIKLQMASYCINWLKFTKGISATFTVKFWRNRLSNLLMALQKDASFTLQIKHLLCLTNAVNMSSLLLTLT